MKHGCLMLLAISTMVLNTHARANSDQEQLNNDLFQSVVENNIDDFREYLELGADPNWLTDGETYPSSAFCEATKPGNEDYLESIVQLVINLDVPHGVGLRHSPAACAILYSNISAFKTVVDLGIDVSAVLDPEIPPVAQSTLLDRAITSRKSDIIWEMIQHAEPSEKQITQLIRSLEFFGGFEGDRSRTERLTLTRWLQDRGYEVELAPAAPDPRTIKR